MMRETHLPSIPAQCLQTFLPNAIHEYKETRIVMETLFTCGTSENRRKQLMYETRDSVTGFTDYLQSGAATCSEGFVICFLKVPLACLAAWQLQYSPTSWGTLAETCYKTFGTS